MSYCAQLGYPILEVVMISRCCYETVLLHDSTSAPQTARPSSRPKPGKTSIAAVPTNATALITNCCRNKFKIVMVMIMDMQT